MNRQIQYVYGLEYSILLRYQTQSNPNKTPSKGFIFKNYKADSKNYRNENKLK